MLSRPTALFLGLAILAAISCNRATPEPAAPVQPLAPAAPAAPAPPAPPKEGATAATPNADAPSTAADAPNEPAPPKLGETPKPALKKQATRTREIHRTEGSTGCVEMYGTCTPPPDRLCTSSALYVDCGQRAQVPSSGEWVHCSCD
ncbi:MAG TPA: hypothetical protein VJR89_35875 [Polyangiales bacterium]|nr:hypothetical protein [Polyangiales bacterium]